MIRLAGSMSPVNCGVLPMILNTHDTESGIYGLIDLWLYLALVFLAISLLSLWV